MKLVIPTVLIFAAAGTALDIGKILGQAGPLIKQGKCALPCIYAAGNKLECDGKGPFDTICDNLDEIQKQSAPCVNRCGIEPKYKGKWL